MDVYYSVRILSATGTIRIKQSLNMLPALLEFCWKSNLKKTLSKINQLSLMHSCAFNWRSEMCMSTASLGLWHESNIYSNDFHSSCTNLTQTSVISMHYIIPSEGTSAYFGKDDWWLYFKSVTEKAVDMRGLSETRCAPPTSLCFFRVTSTKSWCRPRAHRVSDSCYTIIPK